MDAAGSGQGILAEAGRAHQDALLLGSVFHDVLYYIRPDRKAMCKSLPPLFHGSGGRDSNALLRAQLKHARKTKDHAIALAFLAGMASHVCADVSMHPFIWHATGNYDDPDPTRRSLARQRHRVLETLLDMLYGLPPAQKRSLSHLRNELEPLLHEALPMTELAHSCGSDEKTFLAEFEEALDTYARVQALTEISPLGWLAYVLWPLLPAPAKEIAALLRSPQWRQQSPLLSGPLEYRNPQDGTRHTESVEQMIDRATDNTKELWATLGKAFTTGELPEPGPNLDTGRPCSEIAPFTHFRQPPLLRLPGEK